MNENWSISGGCSRILWSGKNGEVHSSKNLGGAGFLSESLITDGGQKISVDFAGSLNVSGDGPAFRNAQLIIDGEPREGDIDVHIKQQGLIRHSYQAECNYNRVILEVCLFPNPDPKRRIKKLIPTLFFTSPSFSGD